MTGTTADERRPSDGPAQDGVVPEPYGVVPSSHGASTPPRTPQSAFRQTMAAELRGLPHQMGRDLRAAMLELLVTLVVAAVVVGSFALVGYAIGGSTGALLAGAAGVGAFIVLRLMVGAGLVVWGLGRMATRARRPR